MPRHIRKGDTVIVTAGNDRGATGQVLRVLTDSSRVLVQGVNMHVKHLKPTQASPKGALIRREMPIHISNVSPVVEGKPTRVRFETRADGSKVRIAVRGGKELHTLRGERSRAAAGAAKTTKRRRATKSTRTTKKKETSSASK